MEIREPVVKREMARVNALCPPFPMLIEGFCEERKRRRDYRKCTNTLTPLSRPKQRRRAEFLSICQSEWRRTALEKIEEKRGDFHQISRGGGGGGGGGERPLGEIDVIANNAALPPVLHSFLLSLLSQSSGIFGKWEMELQSPKESNLRVLCSEKMLIAAYGLKEECLKWRPE